MLNWDSASTLTKAMLIATIAAVLAGLVFLIMGAIQDNTGLFTTASVFLMIGIIAHLIGFGSRMRDGRRALKRKMNSAGPRRGR